MILYSESLILGGEAAMWSEQVRDPLVFQIKTFYVFFVTKTSTSCLDFDNWFISELG